MKITFTRLTLVYVLIFLGITFLMALYYAKKPIKKNDRRSWKTRFWDYTFNNNSWECAFIGMFLVTLTIALNNFGPSLWLPEKYPTPAQRSTVGKVLNHILYGTNAPAEAPLEILDPAKPLPWAKGTWDWWKYTRIYFLIALGFLPFAVWDEFCHACIATEKFIAERIKKEREKEEERKKHSPTPATGGQTVATDNKGGATIGFKIFSWSFLADAAGAFMFEFLDHRRKRS